VAKVLELIERRIADAQLALLFLAPADLDRETESLTQLSFGRLGIGDNARLASVRIRTSSNTRRP